MDLLAIQGYVERAEKKWCGLQDKIDAAGGPDADGAIGLRLQLEETDKALQTLYGLLAKAKAVHK